jgi:hypothetical protein
MKSKLWLGFIVTYIVLMATNFLIHNVIMVEPYRALAEQGVMRGEEAGTMWIYFVTAIFVAFFFTLIYSKGHEGKGPGEGVRFGLYAGIFIAVQFAYDSYASYPLPYGVALQWFIYTLVQYIILGLIISMVYGKSTGKPAA